MQEIQIQNNEIQNQNSQVNENKAYEQIEVISVSKEVYSVLMSIIDSSEKAKYYWNRPIKVSENMIKFVKYKAIDDDIEVLQWKIIVIKGDNKVIISVYKGDVIAELVINKSGHFEYIMRINGVDKEFRGEGLHEFEKYYITADVPYAVSITLSEIASKLLFFYRKAKPVFG